MPDGGAQAPFAPLYAATPRDRILQAASRLFCNEGIAATGVDRIVAEAGVAKTTLYHWFGSKTGLVDAVLDAEGRAWRAWFIGELHKTRGTPEAKLAGMFAVLERWFSDEGFSGCPFINAVGESDKSDDHLRKLTIMHKTEVLAAIEQVARETGAADPAALTHQLALLIDGAIVTALITKDPKVARTAGEAAKSILSNTLPGQPNSFAA